MRDRSLVFPDWIPDRRVTQSALTAALDGPKNQIYLDASVLTLAYEIGVGARNQMLAAFERFDTRVHVPLWAAHETWNNASKEKSRNVFPFREPQDALKTAFQSYLKMTLSQLEEEFVSKTGPRSRSAFLDSIRALRDQTAALIRDVDPRRPEPAAEKLHEFLDRYALSSDLAPITARAMSEGPFRHAHGIPPGHADARKARQQDGKANERTLPNNQFGDLIIWLEILEHANRTQAEEIVLITRDNTKGDWVYLPDRVVDDRGNCVKNESTTLPQPLLVSEAKTACPRLNRLHIVSLEDAARVLMARGENVSQLILALQSDSVVDHEPATNRDTSSREPEQSAPDTPRETAPMETVTFRASDLTYEPQENEPFDEEIRALYTQDWSNQNAAARRVVGLNLARASRLQCIHLGISLARASNGLAVEPLAVLRSLLVGLELSTSALNLMVGSLAEIYLSEEGELQQPSATPALSELVFEAAQQPSMGLALNAIMDRLAAQRARYLALPNESSRVIRLAIGTSRAASKPELVSLKADGVELLEMAAPASRRLPASGSGATVSVEWLVQIVAAEFGIPPSCLEADLDLKSKLALPDHLGFILWGPNTGVELRREPA